MDGVSTHAQPEGDEVDFTQEPGGALGPSACDGLNDLNDDCCIILFFFCLDIFGLFDDCGCLVVCFVYRYDDLGCFCRFGVARLYVVEHIMLTSRF